MPLLLKDYCLNTTEENSLIIKIPKSSISSENTEHNLIKYTISLTPHLRELSSIFTLCAIKVSLNSNKTIGFFCKKVDKNGLEQMLFGFPGDFFMGTYNIWTEPVFPIPLSLAINSKLLIQFSTENTCEFPDIEIRMCPFHDITNLHPQVFVYKTRKNEEDCAIVSGIYFPLNGFVQKPMLRTQLLPATYKLIPSMKLLSSDWKDSSQYQTEFSTVKLLEDAVTNGIFGGQFTTHSDFEKDCTVLVQ